MGFLFHGHYANYYEIGRTESIRQLGMTYKSIEEAGVLMPVTDLTIKFMLPAYYDELITVISSMPALPEWRMVIHAEMHNEKGQVLNKSEVRLAFLDAKTRRICRAPDIMIEKMGIFF